MKIDGKAVNMPTSPEEVAEFVADEKNIQWLNESTDHWKQFNDAQVGIYMKKNGSDLNAQMKEQAQLALAEMLGKNGGSPVNYSTDVDDRGRLNVYANGQNVSNGKGTVYNKAAAGAKLEAAWRADGNKDQFNSMGEYCKAIWAQGSAKGRTAPDYQELTRKLDKVAEVQNSFGTEVPADGGFLVPEIMRSELLQIALEESIVRQNATVIPMQTLRVPIPYVDDKSHVSSLFGGVTYSFAEESASLTESQGSFGRVVLEAKKLTGFFKVPNELLADAPAFSAWFDQRIPRGLAWYEDERFMNGTGVGEPLGFINCPAAVNVAKQGGQASSTIVTENIANMYARMFPQSRNNAVWIANIDTFPQLATMGLVVGTGGGPVWMASGGYNNGLVGAPPMTIYGRPVYFTEKCPALGTQGCLSYVDLSYYLVGDRQMMQVSASEHYAFQNDQTAYRIIERIDGQPWLQSPLTPHKSSSTLSAFVQFAD